MNHSKKININKRHVLKTFLLAGTVPVWQKPVINSVVLPAHAITSGNADSISVSSLDSDNPFARFVLIADASDNVLANCGQSGGTALVENLGAGTYRVFADSNGPQNHIIDVTVGGTTQRIVVPTDLGTCNYLVATIDLPGGTIVAGSGEQIAGGWDCMTNLGVGCS